MTAVRGELQRKTSYKINQGIKPRRTERYSEGSLEKAWVLPTLTSFKSSPGGESSVLFCLLLRPRGLADELQPSNLHGAGEDWQMARSRPHSVVVRQGNIRPLRGLLEKVLADSGLVKNLGDRRLRWAPLREHLESNFSGCMLGLAEGSEIAWTTECLAIESDCGLKFGSVVWTLSDARIRGKVVAAALSELLELILMHG